jgi:PAS domain-containing protein
MPSPTSSIIKTVHLDFNLVNEVMAAQDVSVIFDTKLNYLLVNKAACECLNKKASELIGRSIIDLYPSIIASANHRNLLKAANGETILDFEIKSDDGKAVYVSYIPVLEKEKVIGVLTKSQEEPS